MRQIPKAVRATLLSPEVREHSCMISKAGPAALAILIDSWALHKFPLQRFLGVSVAVVLLIDLRPHRRHIHRPELGPKLVQGDSLKLIGKLKNCPDHAAPCDLYERFARFNFGKRVEILLRLRCPLVRAGFHQLVVIQDLAVNFRNLAKQRGQVLRIGRRRSRTRLEPLQAADP